MPVAEVDIEDDSVVIVDKGKHPRFFARVGNVDRVAVLSQYPANEGGNRSIVLGDEQTDGKPRLGEIRTQFFHLSDGLVTLVQQTKLEFPRGSSSRAPNDRELHFSVMETALPI